MSHADNDPSHNSATDAIDRPTLEQLIMAAGGTLVSKRTATHIVDLQSECDAQEEEAEAQVIDEKWVFDEVMGRDEGEESSDSEEF